MGSRRNIHSAISYPLQKGRVHSQFSGALEERSGKGQKASTYLSYIVEDIAAVEVRGASGPQGEPAARLHAESEHTKRSSGALEEWSRKWQKASAHRCAPTCDVQPDQLGRPRIQDLEHTSLTHAI